MSHHVSALCILSAMLAMRDSCALRLRVEQDGFQTTRSTVQPETDNCLVVPFYNKHFDQAVRLLDSVRRFATDISTVQIVLVASRFNGSDSPKQFCTSAGREWCLHDRVHIVSLEELLVENNESWSTEMDKDPKSWTCGGNVWTQGSLGMGRILQGMKKILGGVHARQHFGCSKVWIMDAESYAFRQFSFAHIFSSWLDYKPLWILNYTGLPQSVSAQALRWWEACHSDIMTEKFGVQLLHGGEKWTSDFWPQFTRTRPLNDFWIYETQFLVDIVGILKKRHGTFVNAWTAQPSFGEVSYLDVYHLYAWYRQSNPYNMTLLDIRAVLEQHGLSESAQVTKVGQLGAFFDVPASHHQMSAEVLGKLPIHSYRGGVGDEGILHFIKCHNLDISWCNSNCELNIVGRLANTECHDDGVKRFNQDEHIDLATTIRQW